MKQHFLLAIFLLSISFTLLFGWQQAIFAAPKADPGTILGKLNDTAKPTGVADTDVTAFTAQLVKGALSLVGLIFFALMIYAGFMWMTARGEEDQIGKARGTVKASVIGMVVVLGAYGLTNLITERLIGSGGYAGQPVPTDTAVGCCIDWRTVSGDVTLGIPVEQLTTRSQCEVLGTTRTGGGDQLAGPEGDKYWQFFPDITTQEACFKKVSTIQVIGR